MAMASWVPLFFNRNLPPMPYRVAIQTSPDMDTVFFAVGAALIATLTFGLVPALQASKPGLAGILKGRCGGGPAHETGADRLGQADSAIKFRV